MNTPVKEGIGLTVGLDTPYEKAIGQVTDALKAEGFGVLTEIDVQATFKKKLDADFRRYVILGACNPTLAHRALNASLDIGMLLPCNVIVYEEGTGSVVSLVDPLSMLGMADIAGLDAVAQEARTRLERVRDALAAG
ncbi:MAG: DUF302 domain-containing protein [Caldilineaceae bacterium]|nr:DUF302 domain-containing protein [Caldilineaceae bacterium]